MKNTTNIHRRKVLLSGACLLTVSADSLALSPKAPSLSVVLSQSELVVQGVVERYIFRGVSRVHPEEFDQDFDEEGTSDTRAMDLVLRVDQILFRRAEEDLPPLLRIHFPIPTEQRTSVIGTSRIFFLYKPHLRHRGDGQVRRTCIPVIAPLPITERALVREVIEADSKR